MDSPEHEKSSSSPNASIAAIHITEILRHENGRRGEELEVTLSDASSFFAALNVWERHPFHEGDHLSPERLGEIVSESERVSVRFRALDLLAISEHSEFTLSQKLQMKLRHRNISVQTIRNVLDELVREGALSDSRYAENWVRSRNRRHPEGRSHLSAGLRQRGVSSDVAEEAIDTVLANEQTSMTESARRFAEATIRRKSPTAGQLASALYRRGFRGDIVRSVVFEFAREISDSGTE